MSSALSQRTAGTPKKIANPLDAVSGNGSTASVNSESDGAGSVQQKNIACNGNEGTTRGTAYYEVLPSDSRAQQPQQQQQTLALPAITAEALGKAHQPQNSMLHTKKINMCWEFSPSQLLSDQPPKFCLTRGQVDDMFRVYPMNMPRGNYKGARVGNLDAVVLLSIEVEKEDNLMQHPVYVVNPSLHGKIFKHGGRGGRGLKGKALHVVLSSPAVYNNKTDAPEFIFKRREFGHLLPLAEAYAGLDLSNIEAGIVELPPLDGQHLDPSYTPLCLVPPTSFLFQIMRNHYDRWGLKPEELPLYQRTNYRQMPVKVKDMLFSTFRRMVQRMPRDNLYDMPFFLEPVFPSMVKDFSENTNNATTGVMVLATFRYMFTSEQSLCVTNA
jgi:hypothetical protein